MTSKKERKKYLRLEINGIDPTLNEIIRHNSKSSKKTMSKYVQDVLKDLLLR